MPLRIDYEVRASTCALTNPMDGGNLVASVGQAIRRATDSVKLETESGSSTSNLYDYKSTEEFAVDITVLYFGDVCRCNMMIMTHIERVVANYLRPGQRGRVRAFQTRSAGQRVFKGNV